MTMRSVIVLLTLLVSTSAKRWEVGRFLQTARFYNGLFPKLPFMNFLRKPDVALAELRPGSTIWEPNTNVGNSIQWGPLDDVVMGGVSKSNLVPGQTFNGVWTGYVTTENNGGFSGIRTKTFNPKFDLSACRGIQLKVKGDGNRYKFILRDDEEWNGIAWSFSFDTTNNKITEVKIPFDALRATKYARTISNQSFERNNVCAIQFSLSKFEYDGQLNPKFKEGNFALEIISIKTY